MKLQECRNQLAIQFQAPITAPKLFSLFCTWVKFNGEATKSVYEKKQS